MRCSNRYSISYYPDPGANLTLPERTIKSPQKFPMASHGRPDKIFLPWLTCPRHRWLSEVVEVKINRLSHGPCYHSATRTGQTIPIHQEDGSSDFPLFPWVGSSWVVSD